MAVLYFLAIWVWKLLQRPNEQNKDCRVGQLTSLGLEGSVSSIGKRHPDLNHQTSDLFMQPFSLPVSKVILQKYDYGVRIESEVSVSVVADLFQRQLVPSIVKTVELLSLHCEM